MIASLFLVNILVAAVLGPHENEMRLADGLQRVLGCRLGDALVGVGGKRSVDLRCVIVRRALPQHVGFCIRLRGRERSGRRGLAALFLRAGPCSLLHVEEVVLDVFFQEERHRKLLLRFRILRNRQRLLFRVRHVFTGFSFLRSLRLLCLICGPSIFRLLLYFCGTVYHFESPFCSRVRRPDGLRDAIVGIQTRLRPDHRRTARRDLVQHQVRHVPPRPLRLHRLGAIEKHGVLDFFAEEFPHLLDLLAAGQNAPQIPVQHALHPLPPAPRERRTVLGEHVGEVAEGSPVRAVQPVERVVGPSNGSSSATGRGLLHPPVEETLIISRCEGHGRNRGLGHQHFFPHFARAHFFAFLRVPLEFRLGWLSGLAQELAGSRRCGTMLGQRMGCSGGGGGRHLRRRR
mmetsp:Transcript_27730/g.69946  ORF Transcript_27730/g.69946 Transcript_27730/m.69946 type:complete len:402 (-) Transcript_27730:297-1502(-)